MFGTDFEEKFIVLSQFKLSDSGEVIKKFLSSFAECQTDSKACLIALPYVYLSPVQTLISDNKITIGSREMNNADPGSFTGTIAAKMLKLKDSHFVLLGTYEKRKLGENDDSINQKIHRALEADITPFLCIGENFDQFESGDTEAVISKQIEQGIRGLTVEQLGKIIILCEAPWVDSTLRDITVDLLVDHYRLYKRLLRECVGEDAFLSLQVVYRIPENFAATEKLVKALQPRGFYCSNSNDLLPLLDDATLCFSQNEAAIDDFLDEQNLEEKAEDIESYGSTEEPQIQVDQGIAETSKEENGDTISNFLQTSIQSENLLEEVEQNGAENSFQEGLDLEREGAELDEEFREKLADEPHDSKTKAKAASAVDDSGMSRPSPSDGDLKQETIENNLPIADEDLLPATETEGVMTEVLNKDEVENKLQELGKLHKELSTIYEELENKVKGYAALKKEIVEKNHHVQEGLKELDPVIAQHINRGDVAFFKENPEKANEGSEVLDEILVINEIAQEIGTLFQQISSLNLKAKDIRHRLEDVWNFFTANRLEIKNSLPELLPNLPPLLKEKEPQFDLALFDSSKLQGQRVRPMNL